MLSFVLSFVPAHSVEGIPLLSFPRLFVALYLLFHLLTTLTKLRSPQGKNHAHKIDKAVRKEVWKTDAQNGTCACLRILMRVCVHVW
jgi:hypothetical protein